jgi:uncharacterized membrane protein YbhN (UPF0104 family)
LNKTISSLLKVLVSLSLGVLIIVLVARNFAKPLKIKLESNVFSDELTWTLSEWQAGPGEYIYVGDTLAQLVSSTGEAQPLLSIYEGSLVSTDVEPGNDTGTGAVVARIKVDIWKIVREAFNRANYWWIVLSILMSLLSHYSRAVRWKMMFKPMGYDPKTANAFGAVLVNYLANLAFPRLGEVLRCSILARYEKIPIHKSLGTMITERVLDVICLGIVFLLMLVLQYSVFSEFYTTYMPEQQGGYMKFIILGGGLVFIAAGFFLYRAGKLPFGNRIRDLAIGLWDGIRSVRDLDKPWLFVFHTVFIWTMYYAMTAVCLEALPETSSVTPLAGLPILFFGGIAMVAVQGGLGLYPYFVSKILLLYGIAETVGYAFGWIIWSAQTVIVIAAGLLAFMLLAIFNKQ